MTSPPDNPNPDDQAPTDPEHPDLPEAPVGASGDSAQEVEVQLPTEGKKKPGSARFFVRGLATLLPAVLTLWLLVFAYGFMRDKIAAPINWGIQTTIINYTEWPPATDDDYVNVWDNVLSPSQREEWEQLSAAKRSRHQAEQALVFDRMIKALVRTGETNIAVPSFRFDDPAFEKRLKLERLNWMKDQPEIVQLARRHQLQNRWDSISLGNWHLLDLIGLIVAVILFYFAGVVMSNVIGRSVKDRGERLVDRVPLIRRVYPAVKQITDFFFADGDNAVKFNRVVAVEYPRKGLWSVGLVTGETMRSIQNEAKTECLTVFIPSSPTPFTGYVITVPRDETIDLDINIEDALKFAVSGGVLVPPSQRIDRTPSLFKTPPTEPSV
ncbi:MAG: DUF502 domain-containing protein [Planctomycetota bacterium]